MKLNAKELRKSQENQSVLKEIKRNPIYLVLDNVLDTYNIGSLFRLSDAIAVEKMYICGKSEYPPSSRIHKAAVGTEAWVPWEKRDTTIEVIKELKDKGIQIITVEQDERSIDYRQLTIDSIMFPCAIVVGHESDGVSEDVLNASDIIVELPMMGINKSFNVWGSAAVISYKIVELLK
jgi:23S rRNA (guanosine2251-2'-O)-methyltransferase